MAISPGRFYFIFHAVFLLLSSILNENDLRNVIRKSFIIQFVVVSL